MGRDGGSRLIFYRTLNSHYSFCVGVIAFVLISSTSDGLTVVRRTCARRCPQNRCSRLKQSYRYKFKCTSLVQRGRLGERASSGAFGLFCTLICLSSIFNIRMANEFGDDWLWAVRCRGGSTRLILNECPFISINQRSSIRPRYNIILPEAIDI
jgi:hypothetical protein